MSKHSLLLIYITILVTILSGCTVFGIRSGYEELNYTILESIGDVEVRQYPKRLAAEVTQMKDDKEAFMLLFGYISGQNSSSKSVAMTTPVQVEKVSAKIAMTVPVEKSLSSDNAVSMRFFLPRSFSTDTVPKPKDPRIKLVSLPQETFAVISYSGFNSDDRFQRKSDRLSKLLTGSKWTPVSPASFLGYDAPFTIPFLRRNEAIQKVELQQQEQNEQ